ncbi:MAG TPA: phospho-sugar mutase [Acidimicrobiales bacterium]|nr:phospho-sugar mutase [Acidimicrobiales bacterium]
MNPSLRDDVVAWMALDPDADDRRTLRDLLDAGNEAELERRFATPLTFGTAGLRGPEMAGPAGMNRATVRRATQGVLAWLDEIGVDVTRGVVVGRDARHGSETFNDEVVQVLLGAGAVVFEMPSPLPTPFVPYCVKALNAAAGVMITASHNPPEDNGYKLYASDGAQIVPPDDEVVERHARDAGPATLADRSSPGHSLVASSLLDEYRAHVIDRFGVDGGSALRITYTPLHGVGGETMMNLFADAGYAHVTPVAGQFKPDGSFPTLAFPNPEEPGALDLAIRTANDANSTLVIANDPDADRLGAAARSGEGWRLLRGDEIGWLLASALLDEIGAAGQMVATTIVSSTMLEKMANAAGVDFATTLTGFKWIARAAGSGVLGFGYEEALGFAVDARVADKDGLSAALALSRLAHELSLNGSTVLDRLDELETRFGVHATSQLALRAQGPEGPATIRRVVAKLAGAAPTALGTLRVTEVVDLNDGWRGLSPTEGLYLGLGEWGRVIVRPSGTEPKVKAYVEVTPPNEGSLADQRAVADEVTRGVRDSLTSLLRF